MSAYTRWGLAPKGASIAHILARRGEREVTLCGQVADNFLDYTEDRPANACRSCYKRFPHQWVHRGRMAMIAATKELAAVVPAAPAPVLTAKEEAMDRLYTMRRCDRQDRLLEALWRDLSRETNELMAYTRTGMPPEAVVEHLGLHRAWLDVLVRLGIAPGTVPEHKLTDCDIHDALLELQAASKRDRAC